MVQFRILGYLIPRLSQLLGWTVDTTPLIDPLLKNEEIPKVKTQALQHVTKLQQKLYHPPPYLPPRAQKVSS
jgi:hypothetical protein